MTEREWCERIWPVLVETAKEGLVISYNSLKERVEFNGWQRTLSQCLGRIANYCHIHGWPILTAVVVNKKTGRPGSGIPFVSDPQAELKRVHAFPWDDQRSPKSEEFPESACVSAKIIDRGRGPELEGTRITVYAVMDHVRAGDPAEVIRDALLLSPEQVDAALNYIHSHWEDVNREYDRILERVQQGNPSWVEELLARTREERLERLRQRREDLAHADRAG